MIEDALDMSRLENNKFSIFREFFELRQAIEGVCSIMRFQLEQKGIQLKIDIDSAVPHRIFTDQKRFKQVLFNLLGNASKFTFQGSITVKVNFEDDWLISDVLDTGIGISEEDLKKLFQFFGCIAKSKDINRGGMGLGLTISKMIL